MAQQDREGGDGAMLRPKVNITLLLWSVYDDNLFVLSFDESEHEYSCDVRTNLWGCLLLLRYLESWSLGHQPRPEFEPPELQHAWLAGRKVQGRVAVQQLSSFSI